MSSENWRKKTLGEVAKWGSGGTPSRGDKSFYKDGTIPWVKTGDLNDGLVTEVSEFITKEGLKNSSAKLFPKGSICIAMYGATIGRTGILTMDAATNQACAVAQPFEKVNDKFLWYFLKASKNQFVKAGKGGAQPNISQTLLKAFPIAIPEVDEQEAIVGKLENLLARNENIQTSLTRLPSLLADFREAVLRKAVTGELTKKWSKENGYQSVEELLAATESPLLPNRFKTRTKSVTPGRFAISVGLPDLKIPKRYRWVPLYRIATMASGHTPSRKHPEWWGGKVNWIGIKDAGAHHGGTIMETMQKTNELGLANSAARILPASTVCFSRTASVGYVVKMGVPMATSQDFVNWTCTDAVDPDWLKWLLVAEKYSMKGFGSGSTHTTIYYPELLSLHVALPPIEEQREIVRRIESLFAIADRMEAKLASLTEQVADLPQAILGKAFRGGVVVKPRPHGVSIAIRRRK